MGHLLQLVHGDVLLKDKDVDRFNTLLYMHMTNHRSGQSACYYKDVAMELNHAVLTSKYKEETRWVCSEICKLGIKIYQLSSILSQVRKKLVDHEMQHYKSNWKELKHLCDAKMIAFGIGLCCILDLYAPVSLNAQDLNLFPTTVASDSLKMCADLKDLSNE